jgi:hypothetical protein
MVQLMRTVPYRTVPYRTVPSGRVSSLASPTPSAATLPRGAWSLGIGEMAAASSATYGSTKGRMDDWPDGAHAVWDGGLPSQATSSVSGSDSSIAWLRVCLDAPGPPEVSEWASARRGLATYSSL